MKKLIILLIGFLPFVNLAQKALDKPIIIDHHAASMFDSIPDSMIAKAINLKVMFRHASVGTTVNNGLNCVQGTRTNPSVCKLFPPYKYDRRNWEFQLRSNSGWYGKITDFRNEVYNQIDSFDIYSFKYCYLEGLDEVAEPCGGAKFSPALVKKAWDSLRTNMEMLESKYPDKVFVWWTIPLTQPGQHCTDTLNFLIRDYVRQNNKILFDIADIQSWDTLNQHLTNAYGWELAFSGYCGEEPPGPSCHPNWTGSVILAKAYWFMMAQIAGWVSPSTQNVWEQVNKNFIYFYPNPATDKILFSFFLDKTEMVSISIYNSLGVKILKIIDNQSLGQGSQQYEVITSSMPSGIYFYEWCSDDYKTTGKILIR